MAQKLGINGVTTSDIMHDKWKGVDDCLLDGLCGIKKQKSAEGHQNEDTMSAAKGPTDPSEEGENRVFSKVFNNQCVTPLFRHWGRSLQNQSDRHLPRTCFSHHLTKNTKITAREKQGVVLLFLLTPSSSFG